MLEKYPLHLLENLSPPGSPSSTWQGRQHRRTSGSEKNPLVQTRKNKKDHHFNTQIIILLITISPKCIFMTLTSKYKSATSASLCITNMLAFNVCQSYSLLLSGTGTEVRQLPFLIFTFILYWCVFHFWCFPLAYIWYEIPYCPSHHCGVNICLISIIKSTLLLAVVFEV